MATDSFAYSNGDLGSVSGGVWTSNLTNNITGNDSGRVVSQTFRLPDINQAFCCHRFTTSTDSADHSAKVTWTLLATSAYAEIGVFTRMPSSGTSAHGIYGWVGNDGSAQIIEFNNGSLGSELASTSGLTVTGSHTLELRSTGTTHKLYFDEVEILSGTSSHSSTGTHCGIAGYTDAGATTELISADDFEAVAVVEDLELELPVIASTVQFFGPNISPGPVTLEPPVIQETQLFAPTVSLQGEGLFPPVIGSTAELYAPSVAPGAVTLQVPFRSSTASLLPPTVSQFRYPTSISGRKILDQYGNVYLMRTMSSWSLTDLSDSDITLALESIAAAGFNAVTVWAGGGYRLDSTWDDRYERKSTEDPWWQGDPWESEFGDAWLAMDHVADECLRLGLTLNFSFCGGSGTTGARPDWDAVDNEDMEAVGVAVATRYPVASYPNIVWHVMFDNAVSDTTAARINALFTGINGVEGGTARLRWAEPQNVGDSGTALGSVYAQIIAPGKMTAFTTATMMNGFYDNAWNSTTWMNRTQLVEGSYNESGATSYVTGDTEPAYDGSPLITGQNVGQYLREQTLALFIEGGSYINYSHERWWPFGKSGWISSTEGIDWDDVPTHSHTVQQSRIFQLIDQYVADPSWAPDDGTFVTSGVGTGNNKAAVGRSNTAGLVYKPNTNNLTVNLSVFAPFYSFARCRWYDVTSGQYTNIGIFPTTGSRTFNHPGLNDDLQPDWVLIVEQSTDQQLVTPIISGGTQLFAPTIVPDAVSVAPPVISSTAALFTPNVSAGTVALAPPAIASTEQLFAPTLVGGDLELQLPVIDSTAILYVPDVFSGLFPPTIENTVELYGPAVSLMFVPVDIGTYVVDRSTRIHVIRRPSDEVHVRGVYENWPGV